MSSTRVYAFSCPETFVLQPKVVHLQHPLLIQTAFSVSKLAKGLKLSSSELADMVTFRVPSLCFAAKEDCVPVYESVFSEPPPLPCVPISRVAVVQPSPALVSVRGG